MKTLFLLLVVLFCIKGPVEGGEPASALGIKISSYFSFSGFHEAIGQIEQKSGFKAADASRDYDKDEQEYEATWMTHIDRKSQDVKDFKRLYSRNVMWVVGPYTGPPRMGKWHHLTLRGEWYDHCFVFLYIPFAVGAEKRTVIEIEPPDELFIEPPDLSKQLNFYKGDWWQVLKAHHGDVAALGKPKNDWDE